MISINQPTFQQSLLALDNLKIVKSFHSFAKSGLMKLKKFVDILLVDTITDSGWCPCLMKSNEEKEIEKTAFVTQILPC